MIDGSPYNELIAEGNAPLSKQQQDIQARKLAGETAKRQHESTADRKQRVAKYVRERDQDHQMLSEMVKAFQYSVTGEDTLDGHKVWVLKATPRRAICRMAERAGCCSICKVSYGLMSRAVNGSK